MKKYWWIILLGIALLAVLAVIALVALTLDDREFNSEERAPRSFTAPSAPITSGENAPPGSIHNLPIPDAVAAARSALAERFGIEDTAIVILEALEHDWPDSCLGLGGPEELCAQVITPGYAVLLLADTEYRYRTDLSGEIVRAE